MKRLLLCLVSYVFFYPHLGHSADFYSIFDITSVDLHLCDNPYCMSWLNLTTAPLFKVSDNRSLQFKGLYSYTVNPDFQEYRFRIRPDLFWSTGERVQALDYLRSWKALLDPTSLSPFRFLFVMNHVENIELEEDGEIVLKTSKPAPFLPYFLSLPAFGPLHKNQTYAGSGLYYFKSVRRAKNQLELRPNPYAMRGAVAQSIHVKGMVSENTLLSFYEIQDVDWVMAFSPLFVEQSLRRRQNIHTTQFAWLYLSLNQRPGQFFEHVEARQTLASLFHNFFANKFKPGQVSHTIPFQLDKKRLKKFPIKPLRPLRFLVRSEGVLYEVGMQIAHKIQYELGWPVDLYVLTFPQDLQRAYEGHFDCVVNLYRPDTGLDLEFFLIFSQFSQFNYGKYLDDDFNYMLREYLIYPTPSLFEKIVQRTQHQIPVIPLGEIMFYSLKRPHLSFLDFISFGPLFDAHAY